MKPIRDLMPVTQQMIRLGLVSQHPDEKTWICARCGEIPPFRFMGGWYGRRRCACEIQAQEAQTVASLRQQTEQARLSSAYHWLGQDRMGGMECVLETQTFDGFERTGQPSAFDAARHFAQQPCGVLALYGGYGTGKTHLLAACAREVCERGMPCLFASVVSLFDRLQEAIQQNQDYLVFIRQAIQTPLLLLDDVDKLKPSDFREEVLYKILNGRSMSNRPLALSSNCSPSELVRWVGEAGRSRLMEGLRPVELRGRDYRLEMRG